MKEINELPSKWVIKVSSNSEPKEVRQWRDKIHRGASSWTNSGYIDSTGTWNSSNWQNSTEITLEQFKKFVLKENEISEKTNWWVQATDENYDIINKWFRERASCTANRHGKIGIYLNSSSALVYGNITKHDPPKASHYDFGEEITFEQFKQFILKEKFVLPEKWKVERNKDNYKVINKWFYDNNYGTPCDNYGFIWPEGHSYGSHSDSTKFIYTAITFEQFCEAFSLEKYALKNH